MIYYSQLLKNLNIMSKVKGSVNMAVDVMSQIKSKEKDINNKSSLKNWNK